MAERELITRNQMINELIRIGHGNLSIYTNLGLKAVKAEPELFAHLIAWNEKKGEVRDSKVAFPVLALRGYRDAELYENAAAHLCLLDPRNLVKAWYYNKELPVSDGGGKYLKQAMELYIRKREKSRKWWDRTALQHRKTFKQLYALNHIRPTPRAQRILFDRDYPQGSIFAKLPELKNMRADEAAGFILNNKIPFLIAVGSLGGIKGKTDIVLSLIEGMSGNELITNTNMLQKMGVFENDALNAAYNKAVDRMRKDKRVSTLKAGRAVKKTKGKAAKKLGDIQERRLDALGKVEGDWLILGDCSGSMHISIEVARYVASFVAKQIKGKVYLVFFNHNPSHIFDVTGKDLTEIEQMTKRIMAGGGTSIGCGLDYIRTKGIIVNGIAICSDGGDGGGGARPLFHDAYAKYVKDLGIEPTIYLYHLHGDYNRLSEACSRFNIQLEEFELGRDVDYYSLPNLIKTMRTSRYSLVDEIFETPLLTFNDVFAERKV